VSLTQPEDCFDRCRIGYASTARVEQEAPVSWILISAGAIALIVSLVIAATPTIDMIFVDRKPTDGASRANPNEADNVEQERRRDRAAAVRL